MEPKRNTIPVHRLEDTTDQGFKLEKVHLLSKVVKDSIVKDLHRDDHYIFLLLETGWSRGVIDFEAIELNENMIVCILPGEVHSYYDVDEDVTGWFVALDPGLIPEASRGVLEDPLLFRKPLSVAPAGMAELLQCLGLAYALQQRPSSPYSRQATYSLLACFTAMIAELYTCREGAPADSISRTRSITREFRKMLTMRYKTWKSPGEYAGALHLSLSYLNEAVKETTGFTVSYWIQQEIVLEAKRLLYYSACNVKEIAHELGYEDHTYFSRMFKKMVGKTPGEFRRLYLR
jgi:AraC family transcriptional activator of pobA